MRIVRRPLRLAALVAAGLVFAAPMAAVANDIPRSLPDDIARSLKCELATAARNARSKQPAFSSAKLSIRTITTDSGGATRSEELQFSFQLPIPSRHEAAKPKSALPCADRGHLEDSHFRIQEWFDAMSDTLNAQQTQIETVSRQARYDLVASAGSPRRWKLVPTSIATQFPLDTKPLMGVDVTVMLLRR
jgi:hypothetical protein